MIVSASIMSRRRIDDRSLLLFSAHTHFMCVSIWWPLVVSRSLLLFLTSFYKWKTIYFNLCKLIDILERFSFDTLFDTLNSVRLRAFRVEPEGKPKKLNPIPDSYSVCRILKTLLADVGCVCVCVLQAKRRMVKLRDPIRSDSKSNKYERVEEENTHTCNRVVCTKWLDEVMKLIRAYNVSRRTRCVVLYFSF